MIQYNIKTNNDVRTYSYDKETGIVTSSYKKEEYSISYSEEEKEVIISTLRKQIDFLNEHAADGHVIAWMAKCYEDILARSKTENFRYVDMVRIISMLEYWKETSLFEKLCTQLNYNFYERVEKCKKHKSMMGLTEDGFTQSTRQRKPENK